MDKELRDLFSNLSDEEILEISEMDLDCPIDKSTIKRIQKTSFKKAGLMECKNEKVIKKSYSLIKAATIAACIIIVFTISNTTGFSKHLYNFWTSRVLIGNGISEITLSKKVGLIHIKEDAPKKNLEGMGLKKIESIIGIDLLNSDMYSSDVVYYSPIIPKEDIERIDLWYPACVVYSDDNDKNICGSFMMLTDKATEHVIPNEDIDAAGEKVMLQSFNISNLKTKVILYTVKWSKERITAVFDYNNVHYSFIGNKVSEKEMIKFIESLK